MKKLTGLLIILLTLIPVRISLALDMDAITGWGNRVEIGAQVSGVIKQVNVSVGQQVKKGAQLLQLDQRLFQAKYRQSKILLASKKEELNEAKRELGRSLDLFERTVLSEHELQISKNNHKKAQAEYQHALTEYTKAKLELEYSTITAPFDAVIINVFHQQGESINSKVNTPLLMVIAEAKHYVAIARVKIDDLEKIKTGQEAKITIAGKFYTGKIRSIGLEPEKASDLYLVEVLFQSDELLRAGSKAVISM